MRHFLSLLIATTVTLHQAHANDKWEGYKPVEQADLPPQILNFAQNSIFYVQTVDLVYDPSTPIEYVDPRNEPRITDVKTLNTNLRAQQIETCFKQNLFKCPIANHVTHGTGFLNNGRFYTCRHGFNNWLSAAAKANNRPVSEISPPLILNKPRNGKYGKPVYNSATDPMAQFTFINDDPNSAVLVPSNKKHYDFYKTDIRVKIADFTESSVPGLKSTANLALQTRPKSTEGQEVYIIGYPGKTEFAKLKDRNGTHKLQMSVTHGTVLKYEKDANRINSTNFASVGMSGSPVITDDGNLIGLLCSSTFDETQTFDPKAATSSILPIDSSVHSDYWASEYASRYDFDSEDRTNVSN